MKITRTATALTAAAIGVAALTGCGSQKDDDRCRTSQTVMFFGTDRHYHYGSPSGRIVPANEVPASARKVPGYKAPSAKVAPPKQSPKVDLKKPAPAPQPKPVAPRPAPRAGR